MKLKEDFPQIEQKKLNRPIEVLELSVRSYNCLKRAQINTIEQLLELTESQLSDIRNMGKKSVDEILAVVMNYAGSSDDKADLSDTDESECSDNPSHPPSETDDRPIDIFGFSFETQRALIHIGIRTVQQLMGLSVNDLCCIPNIGRKSILEVIAAKERYKSLEDLTPPPSETDDRPIDIFGFSVRTYNALRREGIRTVQQLIGLSVDDLYAIRNMGKTSVQEVVAAQKEYEPPAWLEVRPKTEYTIEEVRELIMGCFTVPFKGISFKEFREALPEVIIDEEIKKAVGSLLANKMIEYVDFRCYKIYPMFADYFERYTETLDDRPKEILQRRFAGDTLEGIARDQGITRERVRQIESKQMKKLRATIGANSVVFYEDFYTPLFKKVHLPDEFWTEERGLSEDALYYLKNTYGAGSLPAEDALADDTIPVSLRYRVRSYIDRGKLLIDGELLYPRRTDLEDYAVRKYACEEITFSEFAELYNGMLKENRIPFNEKLYYTEDVKRSRSNRFGDSKLCLWKQGERMRYYDIGSRDYTELIDTLHLEGFQNTEVSTQKFMDYYPELMEEYDIHDRYELHNLLKKISKDYGLDYISFVRQPILRFGEFDREKNIFELIRAFSPVTQDELIDFLHDEYGYDRQTAVGYLTRFSVYCHNGVFRVNSVSIPEERINVLSDNLTEDFYFIDEIRNIYVSLFDDADRDDIEPYTLKSMGFLVNTGYALRNYTNASAYFRHLLTKDGLYNIDPYLKRYGRIAVFNQVYSELMKSYQIFRYERKQIITLKRLERLNVGADDIISYCDDVYDFMDNDVYFTMRSLHNDGFEHQLENLGLDDYFYSSILSYDDRFRSQYVFGTQVLYVGNTEEIFTTSDFLVSQLSEYDNVTPDDLIEDLEDRFGIVVSDRRKIIDCIKDTGLYYDTIMDKIYRNKEIYYSDFDE